MSDKIVIDDKEFDFTGAKEIKKEETATGGSPKPKPKKMSMKAKMKHRKESGVETPEIIAEARRLAGTPGGLNINKFLLKHRLIGVNIEKLLQAPLDEKTGYYA